MPSHPNYNVAMVDHTIRTMYLSHSECKSKHFRRQHMHDKLIIFNPEISFWLKFDLLILFFALSLLLKFIIKPYELKHVSISSLQVK